MKTAIIVAHPDDETIWAGGLILRHPDWEWTIVSLCRGSDFDRRPKFSTVCELFGAKSIIYDLNDSDPLMHVNPGKDIGLRIIQAIGEDTWDLVLTHGENGEYGHPRHIEVHNEVLKLCDSRLLICNELWVFAYDCASDTGRCKPAPWADTMVQLSRRELAEKKHIIQGLYGYGKDSFEVTACISPESFMKHKLPKE